jgi:hypothetical protein
MTAAHSQPGWHQSLDACVEAMDRRWIRRHRLDIILIMSVLLLLEHIEEAWYLRMAVTILGAIGILFAPARRHPAFWLVLLVPLAYVYLVQGLSQWIINHKYLYVYWCMALGLALLTPTPRRQLWHASGWLIGGCFAFATLWKLLAPEFPGGGFFHFTLLTDERFSNVASIVGGLTESQAVANKQAMQTLKQAITLPVQVVLQDTERIVLIARAMAIWTIAIEGMIAVAYLSPVRWRLHRYRHLPLILFMVTTYPIATVTGFAGLLAIMAAANCSTNEYRTRVFYIVTFVMAPAFNLPFARVLRPLMDALT